MITSEWDNPKKITSATSVRYENTNVQPRGMSARKRVIKPYLAPCLQYVTEVQASVGNL